MTQGAKVFGVCRQALNNLANEKAAMSPDMAIRLTKTFGGNAENWLQMQMKYALAEARKREGSIHVRRYTSEERDAVLR